MTMSSSPVSKRVEKKYLSQVKLSITFLIFLGGVAIAFTMLIIQMQSGAAAYLAGLNLWSRGQLETVRQSDVYARTGDPSALLLARQWYQIPLGDLQARHAIESDEMDYQGAYRAFLQGGNHPDDIPRMIWLFRLFEDAPYFNDALQVWRDSDSAILTLGQLLDELENAWQAQSNNPMLLQDLQQQLYATNQQLEQFQSDFRSKMSLASRKMATILSFTTVLFFLLLGSIATFVVFRLNTAIRASEHKFRYTFEKAGMGIAQLDAGGHILDANGALCEILAYDYQGLLQIPLDQFIHEEDRHKGIKERQALDKGILDSVSVEQRFHRSDNTLVWAKTTISRFDWPNANSQRYICIVEDISERYRLTEELSYQARHDSLTGLINRRAFEGYLGEALLKARSEHFIHCLCFIDLDQFKVINDTLGHFAGDQLLLQVSQLFTRHLRKSDLLARLGGDEFGLILDCCEPETAQKLAEGLRESLNEQPFVWEGRGFNIGCSIGIVPIMASSGDEAELLQAADSACHMAKEQGRNRVILTYQGDAELAARRVQMEWIERIRHAIESDTLYLDAQKIVALTPKAMPRIEVLVRMRGENGEVIPPGAFLPAAERFGLAHLVDRWVIERVCAHLKANPLTLNQFEACHINISGRSFDHADFTDFTLNIIKRYRVPASKLCFEITETAAISNLADVHNFMQVLREIGSTFALDDFGSGLSSFAYLKQLPVEYLKIDGAFVRNMATDAADRAMVRAINDIGKTLGKIIVAEFVEDQQTLAYLQEIGVAFAQGYHLHRPQRFDTLINSPHHVPSASEAISD
jgi:diguanylate cyclase (GGDEF)-like protein/PAS domain S-box-containing protein